MNAVSHEVGGVLIRGNRGTAKSTLARGLADLLPLMEVVTDCPFSWDNPYFGPNPTVHWSITSYPTVSVDMGSGGTLSLTTTSEGAAHGSALSQDWSGVVPLDQDPVITISGTLNWDGGDPSTATVSRN